MGGEQTVRAEVIAALLIGSGEAAFVTANRLQLCGVRVTGRLDLEVTTLRCPLDIIDSYFDEAIYFKEATAKSVCFSGSHVPAVEARQLKTSGDLRFNKGFSVLVGVALTFAQIY